MLYYKHNQNNNGGIMVKILQNNNNLNYNLNKNYPKRENTQNLSFSPCYDVPVSKIKTKHKNNQTRKKIIVASHLADLTEHIRIHNLMEPIIVSVDSNGVIHVESGHHRLKSFQDLGKPTIPAYFATFESEIARLKWLQTENSHPPALAHKQEDAVKFLQDVKDSGEFENFSAEEMKTTAFEWLGEFYPQLVGRKKGKVYESFLRGEGLSQLIEHTDETRSSYASKFKFTVAAGEFDRVSGSFYVNAICGNALKNCATINAYETAPSDAEDPYITAFMYTGKKTEKAISKNRAEIVEKIKLANKRFIYPVKKIYFIPELTIQTECEIYEWIVAEGETSVSKGNFKKQ